jgi:hypothetical protein
VLECLESAKIKARQRVQMAAQGRQECGDRSEFLAHDTGREALALVAHSGRAGFWVEKPSRLADVTPAGWSGSLRRCARMADGDGRLGPTAVILGW